MINNQWCSGVVIISTSSSPNLEHLMIGCHSNYLLRELLQIRSYIRLHLKEVLQVITRQHQPSPGQDEGSDQKGKDFMTGG